MESSNLISILERKVSAHSWNNPRAFLFSLVLPHFPRNFWSGSTSYYSLAWRATLWARQVSGQMSLVESSLLTQPRRGKSPEGLLPQWAACVCRPAWPGCLLALQTLAVCGSSPEVLKELAVRPGLWNGSLAPLGSWARSTVSGWVLETWVRVRRRGRLPASVFRPPCCQ